MVAAAVVVRCLLGTLGFVVTSLRATRSQADLQYAVTLAADALESARTRAGSALVEGRDSGSAQAQWSAAPARVRAVAGSAPLAVDPAAAAGSLVATGIMKLVAAMATIGVVSTLRTGSAIDRSVDAQARLTRVYDPLDARLRYRADAAAPTTSDGVTLVSLLLDHGARPPLRLKGDRFAERDWPAGQPRPAWRLLAPPLLATGPPVTDLAEHC